VQVLNGNSAGWGGRGLGERAGEKSEGTGWEGGRFLKFMRVRDGACLNFSAADKKFKSAQNCYDSLTANNPNFLSWVFMTIATFSD